MAYRWTRLVRFWPPAFRGKTDPMTTAHGPHLSATLAIIMRHLAMALAAGFLVGGAVAQTPPDEEPIPPRSIQLTAEQDHVIKEIVLKDMHIEPVPRSAEIRIGEKVPPEIELRTFPPLVAEKVPQVRTYKFFITENQIVVVSPQNIIADIIK
jgi:hypothetical protein